jgi:uncharacterized protein (TIGR03067 family)
MKKTTDLDRLQGSWHISSLEIDGHAIPAAGTVVVKGRRFTSTDMEAVYEGEIVLHPAATPPRVDLKFDAGPEKGNTNLGIYDIDGDTWRLCLATRGTVRPSGFATKAGSGFALEILTRGDKPAARTKKTNEAAPPVPRDAAPTVFEGDWQMLSGVMDGRPMVQSDVKWVKRITRGSLTRVVAGNQVVLQVEFTTGDSRSPHEIDYVNTGGAHKGKTQQGIYEFEDGVLRVCVAAPGDDRPGEFRSLPGDGRTLTTWKKIQTI